MGTLVRIQLYASGEAQAKAAFRAAFAPHRRNSTTILSDYQPDSELNRLPAASRADDLFRVLEAAQQLARGTDGAFDVTVGPLTRLWRAGAPASTGCPTRGACARRCAHCGYRKLHLDRGHAHRHLRRSRHAARSRRHRERLCGRRGARGASRERESAARWWRSAAISPSAILRPDSAAGRSTPAARSASCRMRPSRLPATRNSTWTPAAGATPTSSTRPPEWA